MAAEARRPTLEEAPLDKIKEVAEQHSEVLLYFKRQNMKGTIESLPSKVFPITDLLTDGVESFLRDLYGGGPYIVEVRSTLQHDVELVPRYRITVLGPPRALTPTAHGVSPHVPAPTQNEIAASYRFTGSAPLAAGYVPPVNRPSDFMSHTPDQIALGQVEELRAELRNVRRESADRDRKAQAERERLQQQLTEARIANERAQAEARDRALQSQIESLREMMRQPQVPQKPAVDFTALAAIFGAIVPVLTAMISSSKDRQEMALKSQQHATDQQMQMLLALMKKDDGGKSGLELVMTLLPKLMEANNPGKIADVIATMGESQMQTLAMAAQAIQALSPQDDSPGMMIVRTALEGVSSIAEQISHRQLTGQPQQPQLQRPQQSQSAQQSVQSQPAEAEIVAQAPATAVPGTQSRRSRTAPQQQVQQPRTARELAKAIVSDPAWPADLKSTQWIILLTTLHSDRDVEVIGEELAMMLQGMQNTKRLPERFAPMFEDGGPAPSEVLREIFAPLPIALDPAVSERYEAILREIDDHYLEEDEEDDANATEPAANGAAAAEAEAEATESTPATEQ